MRRQWTDHDLLSTSLDALMFEARTVRDNSFGSRITYSPKVFIPFTQLCRDTCGYCTFAQPPARVASPYLSLDQVLSIARAGARVGCHEALFTLGERPELRYHQAARWLADHGRDGCPGIAGNGAGSRTWPRRLAAFWTRPVCSPM